MRCCSALECSGLRGGKQCGSGSQGPGRGGKRVRPPEHFFFSLHQPLPPSVPRQLLLWLGRRVTSSSLEEQSYVQGTGCLHPRVVSIPGSTMSHREAGHGGLTRTLLMDGQHPQVKKGLALARNQRPPELVTCRAVGKSLLLSGPLLSSLN